MASRAAFPLLVDDAAVHAPDEREWVAALDSARRPATETSTASVSLTTGLIEHLEGSLRLGYGWIRDRSAVGAPERDGLLDLTLGLKAPLSLATILPLNVPFKLGASALARLPSGDTASGLGARWTDLGALLIATREAGSLGFDLNGGYTWTAVERRSQRPGDTWFAGMALRWRMGPATLLFAESLATRPTDRSLESNVSARMGGQIELRPGLLLSAAIGRGRDRMGRETVGTLGLTILR